ncbi:hypothetical protein K2173_003939 [Erythroxylum novogranatense]|uniref:RNA-binding S4 domain-containing protein n=1 Tax=Erythroxylum novogranatense TaxID=1862640 RepID=A0AAV8SJR7_9ROSI|nr:hypothetical protein K2173_003939 [Erythroxylum novogranatense]
MLSPYKFYQYFFSVPDADVIRFLTMLTFLDVKEIDELVNQMKSPGYVPNTVQRKLAEEVTRFVHGEDGLNEALKATEALRPGAQTKLDWKAIEGIAGDVPSCSFAYDQVLNLSLVDLSVSAGLFDSKSAARRLLKQGGLYLNNSRVDTESKRIEPEDIVDGIVLLSAGKKNKVIISMTLDGKNKEILSYCQWKSINMVWSNIPALGKEKRLSLLNVEDLSWRIKVD